MSKIGIFIPCYNVANSIRPLLNSFSEEVLDQIDEIVAIDNCSQDDTQKILRDIQSQKSKLAQKLVIIKNHQNYGLGGSQKIAYQYFIDNGFSHFMIIHGDNQGDGEQIARGFFKVFKNDPQVDVIIASRFMKQSNTASYDRARTFGNWVFNLLTFILTGHNMSDSGAAIIFYRTELLKQIPFQEFTNSFQFNPQVNIFLYNLKSLKIVEIPMHWKDSQDKSNITAFNYCVTMLKILLNYRVNKTILRKSGGQLFHADSQRINPSNDILRFSKVNTNALPV